ncbi:MAG: DUF3383 family protein [Paraclostridium sp.]
MGRIVTVNVVDLTRPIEQKGFKSFAIVEVGSGASFTDVQTEVITGLSSLNPDASDALKKSVSAFFTNGGQTLIVGAKKVDSADDVEPYLNEVLASNEFYGLEVIVAKADQSLYLDKVKLFVEGNKKLAVIEINGAEDDLSAQDGVISKIENSDRIVSYSHSEDSHQGIASATAGVCMPQDEGSITWANKVVTGVSASGYTLSDEAKLLDANINYITKEKGLVITQFGRTTSGSNADITRSKDWLENRCAEALTSTLINNKKVPFTVQGMAMISSSLNQVGVQAVSMGMLDSFYIVTPSVKDIPNNDKTNRVLRGVKFIAVLSGAIETIEMELQVKL